ncbi:ROK family protein [Cellulomonas endophytica]|uniref:ROK family protein n=1 Tax=Cellulomonas endophytica TaxID=2494735 RepID=UPI001F0C583D|nr:ROK family protein [Cellulomonas endophytica]
MPLRDALAARTGLPVVVHNDLVARTEAERWFGAGREHDTFALVTIGAGVGMGLVVHGRLVTSPDSGLGLVGHHPLDAAGPRCSEGHRGCASALLSLWGVQGQVSAAVGRWVGYDEALDLAAAGAPGATEAVRDAGRALGLLVATVANLTLARTVVLGGEGVRLAEVAADAVAAGLAEHRDPDAAPVPLVVRGHDRTEWARGGAVTAIQALVTGGAAGA